MVFGVIFFWFILGFFMFVFFFFFSLVERSLKHLIGLTALSLIMDL